METYIPKQYITILNAQEYAIAAKAIKKIVATLSTSCDEDEMPEIKVEYDKMFGTKIALSLIVPEYGMQFSNEQLISAMEICPRNCTVSIIPRTDTKKHEHGHGIQNVYLGFFTPAVVAIPSVARFRYREFRSSVLKSATLQNMIRCGLKNQPRNLAHSS